MFLVHRVKHKAIGRNKMMITKRYGGSIVTLVLIAWLVALVVNVCYTYRKERASHRHLVTRQIPAWRNLLLGRSPSQGDDKAHVIIIEFVDYQCPVCRALEANLTEVIAHHANNVALYRLDFPLQGIHPFAMHAAIAARCAAIQGITAMYQAQLFKQASFANFNWTSLARRTGVKDLARFSICVNTMTPYFLIKRDIVTGNTLGVSGTPTIIVNGNLVLGYVTKEELERLYIEAKSRDR
jgi:protein-disulfide isomerase